MPTSDALLVSLPPELWGRIADFLDLRDLCQFYLLNRAFYIAFISLNYRKIHFQYLHSPEMAERQLALLLALQNPEVSSKVQSLHMSSSWITWMVLIFTSERPKSPSRPRPNSTSSSLVARLPGGRLTKEAIEHTIQSAMGTLCNVSDLSLTMGLNTRDDASSNSESLILGTIWTACSQTLVKLTIYSPLRTPDHTFGRGITCPHLRSLCVTALFVSQYPELLVDLRSLIPEDGGCLEEFSINMYECNSPLITTSFGSLRKLRLNGDHTTMPSLLPFIAHHRDLLQGITLHAGCSWHLEHLTCLNVEILTSLSIHIKPFLEHQDEIILFLSRCTCLQTLDFSHDYHRRMEASPDQMLSFIELLRSLAPSLTHLTFPGLFISDFKLLLPVSQCLPNISCLTLTDCYLVTEEIRNLCFSRGWMEHAQMLPGRAWGLWFEDLQAHLKDLSRADLSDSDQEAASKCFVESLTLLAPCCSRFTGSDDQ